jgi:hypothetical protein
MHASLRVPALHGGLLLFWALWLTLVAATNVLDAMKQLGLLPESWTLASYNYTLVAQTVGAHGVPAAVAALLFGGAVLWELLAAGLFWRAFAALRRGRPATGDEVTQAFVVSLALWAAFLLATEATVSYATAATHKGTLIAQLATLLVLRSGAAAATTGPEAEGAAPPRKLHIS